MIVKQRIGNMEVSDSSPSIDIPLVTTNTIPSPSLSQTKHSTTKTHQQETCQQQIHLSSSTDEYVLLHPQSVLFPPDDISQPMQPEAPSHMPARADDSLLCQAFNTPELRASSTLTVKDHPQEVSGKNANHHTLETFMQCKCS